MLDRLSLVVPRLALSAEGADGGATAALADVRVGVNIIGLQRDAVHLPEQLRRAVRTMLDAIATHYRRRNLDQADAALLGTIDGVIATAVQDPATMSRELLLQLGGIRRGLFPNAPPYTPQSVPRKHDRRNRRLWRLRSATPGVGWGGASADRRAAAIAAMVRLLSPRLASAIVRLGIADHRAGGRGRRSTRWVAL